MVARAGRHEGRLGRDARAEELGNAADGVARLVREELAAADAALRKGADADAARGAVEAARAQLQDALASMPSGAVAPGQAGMPGEASSGAPGAPSAGADLDRSVSSALARALDALDAALHGAASVPAGPADDSGAPGMQGALDALLAAAAEQAAAMRRARAGDSMASGPGAEVEGVRPGGGDGAQLSSREVAAGQLPLAAARSGGVWGKLPEKMARELMEGMREDAPPEYREMIEIYFRVIAERAGSTVP